MSSSLCWNNPFHFNSFIAKIEKSDEEFDQEEKNQNMSMNNIIFNFSGDIPEMQFQSNIKENDILCIIIIILHLILIKNNY